MQHFSQASKTVNAFEIGWTVIEESRPEYNSIYLAIFGGPEGVGDVISGWDANTIEGYTTVNFEASSISLG